MANIRVGQHLAFNIATLLLLANYSLISSH